MSPINELVKSKKKLTQSMLQPLNQARLSNRRNQSIDKNNFASASFEANPLVTESTKGFARMNPDYANLSFSH